MASEPNVAESSPQPASVASRVFYRIDSTRVSLREYWWGNRSPLILVVAILKLFRVQIPSATDDPNVENLGPFEVSVLPEDAVARLTPLLEEVTKQGFTSPINHAIEDDLHHVNIYLATLRHPSGEAVARVHNRVWKIRTPPKNVLYVEYLTEFSDKTYLWSLSSKADLAAPEGCTVLREVGASGGASRSCPSARMTTSGSGSIGITRRFGASTCVVASSRP
jgi:hypothetical protein